MIANESRMAGSDMNRLTVITHSNICAIVMLVDAATNDLASQEKRIFQTFFNGLVRSPFCAEDVPSGKGVKSEKV